MAGNVPLAVRLWSYRPGIEGVDYGVESWTPALADKHITSKCRDLTYRSAIPGGFQSAALSIDRPISGTGADLAAYQGVAVYDTRTGETAFEGVLEDSGRSVSADGQIWQLTAAGTSAHASDENRPLIYIDRRLNQWETVNASVSGWTVTAEVRETDDRETLVFRWPRGTGLPAGNVSVSCQYRNIMDAGLKIALYGGNFDCGSTDASGDRLFQGITRTGAGTYTATESRTWTTTETSFLATISTDWSYGPDNMRVRAVWTGAAVGAISTDVNWVRVIGLYIRSVLMSKASALITTAYNNNYVQIDQVVEDLLGRILLRYDGTNAKVVSSTYNINQLAYENGTTAADVLDDMILLDPTRYWASWETNPRTGRYNFEWSTWPTTIGLEADTQDGYSSASTSSELYNKILVRYPDYLGRTKTVTRTQSLPALTRAGITRSPQPMDLGDDLGSPENAAQIGDAFLAEHATAPNAGTLTVARSIVDHTSGRKIDPWMLPRYAPGKLIRVRGVLPRADALNRSTKDAVTVFKVMGAEYRDSDNSCQLELDSAPRTVAQLLARKEQRRWKYHNR